VAGNSFQRPGDSQQPDSAKCPGDLSEPRSELGGGAGAGDDLDNGDPGAGGAFGGRANGNCCGGGGGALRGAIFSDSGTVVIRNSRIYSLQGTGV